VGLLHNYSAEFGRFHVFNSLAKTIIGLQEGTVGKPPKPAEAAASISVTGRRFFWRGFSSDRGSACRPANRGGASGTRGRGEARGRGGGATRGGAGRGGHYRHEPYSKAAGEPRGRGRGGRGRG
jgi:hypothetical protein